LAALYLIVPATNNRRPIVVGAMVQFTAEETALYTFVDDHLIAESGISTAARSKLPGATNTNVVRIAAATVSKAIGRVHLRSFRRIQSRLT
jgi:hypothetical protein